MPIAQMDRQIFLCQIATEITSVCMWILRRLTAQIPLTMHGARSREPTEPKARLGKPGKMGKLHICILPMPTAQMEPVAFLLLIARINCILVSIPTTQRQMTQILRNTPGHVLKGTRERLEPKERRVTQEPRVQKENRGRKVIKETQVPECQMWMCSIINPQVPPLLPAGHGLRPILAGKMANISGQKR